MPLSRRRREVSNLQRVTQQTQQREISKISPNFVYLPFQLLGTGIGLCDMADISRNSFDQAHH